MLPLAGIVEDLPDPENRVTVRPDGGPRLRHQFTAYDEERGRQLRRLMAQILKNAGAALCIGQKFPSDEHVAHQCGTLRFGTDPAHAVLDPECRLFGHPNVFVVDGSFMPTSLGVGPALTIIATRHPGVLAAHDVEPPERAAGEFRLNPLYAVEADGRQARLRLTFPDDDYEQEYGACRRYLPAEVSVDRDLLDALPAGAIPPGLTDLARRRVVLDLPERYY